MNPYLEFVETIQERVEEAKGITVSRKITPVSSGPNVLLFSPHPDDECINGLLPLRLMRELGKRIVNIPVTFGSNIERQLERARELDDACAYLGWLIDHGSEGLEALNVDDVVRILDKFHPHIVFMPHSADRNARHVWTHFLVVEALKKMPAEFSCTVVETEFWGAMKDPNLMVAGDAPSVADLVAATSLHAGEVARNPYHVLLPAWMQDNVRRGVEMIGRQGGICADFFFATLYRLRKWQCGELVDLIEGGKTIPMGADRLKEVF